jgi:hypothetical protein
MLQHRRKSKGWPWVQIQGSSESPTINNHIELRLPASHLIHCCIKDTGHVLNTIFDTYGSLMCKAMINDWVASLTSSYNAHISKVIRRDPTPIENVSVLLSPLQCRGQDGSCFVDISFASLPIYIDVLSRAPFESFLQDDAAWHLESSSLY